jgi:hypothetical protein
MTTSSGKAAKAETRSAQEIVEATRDAVLLSWEMKESARAMPTTQSSWRKGLNGRRKLSIPG